VSPGETTRRANVIYLAKKEGREFGGNMDKLYDVSADLEVLMMTNWRVLSVMLLCDGSAAMMAYAKMQFSDISNLER